jgi:HEAT repeat protein
MHSREKREPLTTGGEGTESVFTGQATSYRHEGLIESLKSTISDRVRSYRCKRLIALLSDDKANLATLGELGLEAKDAIPTLVEALKNPNIKLKAAELLGNIGPEAKVAVPALIEMLKDDKPFLLRKIGRIALGKIEPTEVLPALVRELRDGSIHERENAAIDLGQIGPQAKAAVPELVEAFTGDGNGFVRGAVLSALGAIDGRNVVPVLVDGLKDGEQFVRYRAADALGTIGPEAKDAVPALVEALNDGSESVRSKPRKQLSN